jgi:Mn-containing catalase
MQFTGDPHVKESLGFLMTREIAHMQMFTAALADVQPNFPPGVLQGDPRATHTYFDLSDGKHVRGPWNQGQGPWPAGEQWVYFPDPIAQVRETHGQKEQPPVGTTHTREELEQAAKDLGRQRASEIKDATGTGEQSWTEEYAR